MEGFIPDKLLDLLSISAVLSVVLMALIQKIKLTTIVKSKCQIWGSYNIWFIKKTKYN